MNHESRIFYKKQNGGEMKNLLKFVIIFILVFASNAFTQDKKSATHSVLIRVVERNKINITKESELNLSIKINSKKITKSFRQDKMAKTITESPIIKKDDKELVFTLIDL